MKRKITFWNIIISLYSYLTGMQAPRSCTGCTLPAKITASITHRSHVRTSCPSFLCGRETGPAQREWVFLSNWSVSSHQPPCEASESGEVGSAVCIGGNGLELDWSHTACLPSKTHEGGLCLSQCEEEGEGVLTAQQRVAGGEMQPIFSSESELLFKD